jgi:hypothetical protein
VEAQFRGCDERGWCRLWTPGPDPARGSLLRVRPDGVSPADGNGVSIEVRDRLNALLAGMIHQHKRIELWDLRELEDGAFAARVTVNGVDLAADPILLDLREKFAKTIQ